MLFFLKLRLKSLKKPLYYITYYGAVAQLARASHWQCEGRGFESLFLHHGISATHSSGFFLAFFRGDFQLKTHFLSPSRPA